MPRSSSYLKRLKKRLHEDVALFYVLEYIRVMGWRVSNHYDYSGIEERETFWRFEKGSNVLEGGGPVGKEAEILYSIAERAE